MSLPNLTTTIAFINDKPCAFEVGETILQFTRRHWGKDSIPTLCDAPNLEAFGSCRVCSVEVALEKDGPRRTKASCHTLVEPGMFIYTESAAIQKLRKNIIELVLTDHPLDCLTCEVNGNCELQDVAARVGIRKGALSSWRKPPRSRERPEPSLPDFGSLKVHSVFSLRTRLRRGTGPIGAECGWSGF
nr:2Fe-2S iron-sulfur cluster-binding protein [Haliscomenobacter sp.]